MSGPLPIDRYLAGQHVAVWTELLALGEEIREPEHLEAAEDVGRETMRRIGRNLDLICEGLPDLGYEFEPGEGMAQREAPADFASSLLDAIEFQFGELPLALRWWLEDVGEINLIGHCPRWSPDDALSRNDPLVVQLPLPYLLSEFEQWELDRMTPHDQGPLRAPIAPDHLHKANISGGPPESMSIPNLAVDGLVLRSRTQTTLINHVRTCFAGGGFAYWPNGTPPELQPLIDSLEPI